MHRREQRLRHGLASDCGSSAISSASERELAIRVRELDALTQHIGPRRLDLIARGSSSSHSVARPSVREGCIPRESTTRASSRPARWHRALLSRGLDLRSSVRPSGFVVGVSPLPLDLGTSKRYIRVVSLAARGVSGHRAAPCGTLRTGQCGCGIVAIHGCPMRAQERRACQARRWRQPVKKRRRHGLSRRVRGVGTGARVAARGCCIICTAIASSDSSGKATPGWCMRLAGFCQATRLCPSPASSVAMIFAISRATAITFAALPLSASGSLAITAT